jgi:hypothetical protein
VKRGLSIGATVLLAAAVMGYWYESHSDAANVRQCMSGVSSMRSTLEQAGAIDTRGAAYLTEERLRTAAKPFCKEAARDSRVGSRNPETRRRAISELVHTHPEVWDPMCKLGIEAEFLSNSDLRFMTAAERRRFQRDECRYRRGYMAQNTLSVDLGAIAADHPEHYVPLCASQLLSSFSAGRTTAAYTGRELRAIARRSCLVGLRTRVIDATGPGGFNSCNVDKRRLTALVRRVAQDVRSA